MPHRIISALLICVFFDSIILPVAAAESPLQVEWTSHVGTNAIDHTRSLAVDSLGDIYMAGFYSSPFTVFIPTTGTLRKFNSTGTELWFRDDAPGGGTGNISVALDSSGNPYTAGGVIFSFSSTNPPAFLRSFDTSGNFVESIGIGPAFGGGDRGNGVAIDDSDNAYVTGFTFENIGGVNAGRSDGFLVKLDSMGDQLWAEQFGTSGADISNAVAIDDSGNVYITGETEGDLSGVNLGDEDVFLRKYNSSGDLLWSTQTGTSASEISKSVAVDSLENAYITGYTEGDLGGVNAGYRDAFLSKYDSQGNHVWTKQFGTASTDESNAVTIDSADHVYITGTSYGDLSGSNPGEYGVFISKFDGSGDMFWTQQVAPGYRSNALALDGLGNVYIAGEDGGRVFLTKFSSLPLPGDFNRDGIVDAADYTTWRDGVGTIYDPSDYDDWVANYGNSLTETESSSNAVPEPSTFLMFAIALGLLKWDRQLRSCVVA